MEQGNGGKAKRGKWIQGRVSFLIILDIIGSFCAEENIPVEREKMMP